MINFDSKPPTADLKTLGILIFIFISAGTAAADTAQDIEANVDAFMAYLMENLDVVPGYSIAVATPDATVLS